jgi:hypothetical protein
VGVDKVDLGVAAEQEVWVDNMAGLSAMLARPNLVPARRGRQGTHPEIARAYALPASRGGAAFSLPERPTATWRAERAAGEGRSRPPRGRSPLFPTR